MSSLENYLLLSLFVVFLFVFYRWLKRYLQRNEIQELFPYVAPFEKRPLRGKEMVHFELPYKALVRIDILNDADLCVLPVSEQELPKGNHMQMFDCTDLPKGRYQLRLTFPNQVTTRQFELA